jgi:hypothetical protein
MKLEVVKKIDLRIERYDPEIQSFWEKERAAISLAKKTFLKELGAINVFDPSNPRYFLGKKNISDKIYISYSILYPKILKTIYDVCSEEENKNESGGIILSKIFNDKGLLSRIYYFDEFFTPPYLVNFYSFFKKIRIDTLLYFDDGNDQYYFELFRKLDKCKTVQKEEFTGGILHSLTKHFDFFNHYHPTSNDNLDFEFTNFTCSVIDISVNGKIETIKEGKDKNEYKIEKELNLSEYYPKEEGKTFKVSLYKQSNGLNYLTTLYRY